MQNRKTYIDSITSHLAILQNKVELYSSINLYDINIHAEQFYKLLLNRIFSYSLENLNQENANNEAIDLGDKNKQIAVQVTSDDSRHKLSETVEKFCESEFKQHYKKLIVLIIKKKTKRKGIIKSGDFVFDLSKDVLDISELLKSISSIDDINKLEELDSWLNFELSNKKENFYRDPKPNEISEYFNQFLNPNIDPTALLIRAQPTLFDCREFFTDEYSKFAHQVYSIQYYEMLDARNNWDSLRDKDKYAIENSTFSDVQSKNHNLPGGINRLFEMNALRPGKLKYYTVKFVKGSANEGTSFRVWLFLNGRWVFFPKSWTIFDATNELKNDKFISFMIKSLKRLGLKGKKYQSNPAIMAQYIFNELSK